MNARATAGRKKTTRPPAQRRWTQWGGGALVFAAAFHLILLVVSAFWFFQGRPEPRGNEDFLPASGGGQQGAEHAIQQKKQARLLPALSAKRVFAQGAQAHFSLPEPSDAFGEIQSLSSLNGASSSGVGLGVGLGKGAGEGMGNGLGKGVGMGGGLAAGKLFGHLPEVMRKRCNRADRLQRLAQNGGTPACEEAVLKALKWLKTQQNPNGSWGDKYPAAMTGLVLLAYCGHCETPISEDFGDSSLRGIGYLVGIGLRQGGQLATDPTDRHACYEHAIATYALAEVATFCKDLKLQIPGLIEVTKQAGQFIIDHQNVNGGWAYLYTLDGGHTDVSISGWQLQALKACSHAPTSYERLPDCVGKGLAYLISCQDESGGFGYSSKRPGAKLTYHSLTGVGMLCHQMWGKGGRKEIRQAGKYLLENTRFDYNSAFSDLYGHYYESQAMMQIGGPGWQTYNRLFRDQLLNNQDPDGSWKRPGGGQKLRASYALFAGKNPEAQLYRTTLCTLMLEVYYRFLATSGGPPSDRPGI